jgi:hypothetical protein
VAPVSSSRTAIAAWILALAVLVAPSAHATLWVSPSGDDRNPGSEDEPVRTIGRARDIVRTLNHDMADDITVFIAGEHHLDQPVEFGPEDGATNGFSIIYTAAPGEHPVVTGGFRVTGWSLADSGRNLWAAPAPESLAETRDLYVNGTPVSQTRGRLLQFFSKNPVGQATAPEPAAQWKNVADVVFEPPEPGAVWSEHGGPPPVFVRNAFELLGTPGEWYFDRPARRLYYTPRPGENMAAADVEAAAAPGLVVARGTPEHPIAGLIFKGIRFEYVNRPSTPEAGPAAALAVAFAQGIQFLEDEFLHMDSAGLDFGPGVAGSAVDGCLFADIAWSAIRIAGASQVRVAESRFSYVANQHDKEGAIDVDGSQDVTIEHDQIDHFPLAAILRTGAPSGTILEDANLVSAPMIAFHGTPEVASADAPDGEAGVPAAYHAILDEQAWVATVPRPPGDVSAEAEDQFAYVTWMPSCLDGGSPVTSYMVAASTGAKVTVSSEDFQARGYVVFGDLENGRALTFTVSATSALGSSPPSLPTASIKPLSKRRLKPPPAPAAVSVTTGPSGVRVRIFPPASDGGGPVISYTLSSTSDSERDVLEGLDVIHADATHPVQRRIDGISLSHAATVTVAATNAAGDGEPSVVKLK